jgi:hypothetical protein
MVHCKVTITMADGSKGKHEGNYDDTVAATIRALELFPQARKIDVVGMRAADVIPLPTARPRLATEAA